MQFSLRVIFMMTAAIGGLIAAWRYEPALSILGGWAMSTLLFIAVTERRWFQDVDDGKIATAIIRGMVGGALLAVGMLLAILAIDFIALYDPDDPPMVFVGEILMITVFPAFFLGGLLGGGLGLAYGAVQWSAQRLLPTPDRKEKPASEPSCS